MAWLRGRHRVRGPDRVSQLILATPFTLGRDLVEEVPPATVSRLAEIDFPSWVETVVNLLGVPDADSAAVRAIFTRQGAEAMNTMHAFYPDLDLHAELARISTPTLVLAYSEGGFGLDIPLAVAAALDDARSVVLSHYWLHAEEDVEAIRGFLGEPSSSRAASSGTPSNVGSFRTILFTDVVASTPLLAQLKDARMREVMRDHDAILQTAVDEHGGRVIKTIGDAFMAEFPLPSAAVECAIAMQRGIQTQFAHTDVPIRLRIGINAGEPIVEDDDLHGASVVIAKRLESAAAENGILVSEVVRQAVAGKDFEFADQGEVELKGFDEPVRAWSVAWDN